jgi:uncharacterized protein HemX
MWEFGGALLGVITGILGTVFAMGRRAQTVKSLIQDVRTIAEDNKDRIEKHFDMEKLIGRLQQKIEAQDERLDRLADDQERSMRTMEKLDENLDKNSQLVAKCDATLEGLKHLLQNIFDGNLKIKQT